MTSSSMTGLLQHLRKLADPAGISGVGDAELLERFVHSRDEAAFELLVWRHQRMVLGVCRRVLGDLHDAEDAFQAAFLTLARKAASVSRKQVVSSWLHTVAFRIALRVRAGRRKKVEINLEYLPSSGDAAEEAVRRDLAAVLDEEVGRLPVKYRAAVVLCYLEGKSYAEAGRQLGLAVGTLAGHLNRARALLRRRLTRRGIGVSGALLAAVLCEQASSSAASATLVNATVKTAAGAISATVAALAEGAVRSLFLGKVKIAMVAALTGLLVAGMGLVVPAALAPPSAAPESPKPLAAPLADKEKPARVDRYGDPLPPGALFHFGSVRMRHTPAILSSALSPDGKLLATTSGRAVIVWNLVAGKVLHRFVRDQHRHFTNPGLAFAPDGRHLGYVQCDDFACVWDVESGKQVAEFVGGRRQNTLCQFTPDGKTFILSKENRLIFWDLRANKEVHSLGIEDVFLLTPDTRFCIGFDKTRGLRFRDAQSGEETGRLDVVAKYNGSENGVAFAPDGKALAVVHQNKEIRVHEFPGGKRLFSVPLPASAKRPISSGDYWEYQLSFGDRRTLLLGTSSGLVHRWDLAAGKELPALKRHVGAVVGVHASPDGKTIVTTGEDGAIRRWDRQTGRELSEPAGYMGRTHAVYSPDGRYVIVGDARGRLELWDARKGQSLRVLQCEGPAITKLAVSSRGPLLAVARADNTVHFWTLPPSEEPRVLRCGEEHSLSHVWNMHFSPDGRRLLIADGRYHARLWEVATGEVYWRARFGSAVFSPDGETLAMAYVGPYLNLLDASNGKPRARLRQDTNAPERLGNAPAMAFSPDGKHLALAVNGVYLCDARTGATIHHFQAADPPKGANEWQLHRIRTAGEGGVHGLAFSPDGRWLGTSGWDGSVRLWEAATGREVLRFDGHAGDVKQVAFGADSRTLLSCGEDAQAYLWTLRPPAQGDAKPALDALWSALAGEPAKAYRAIWVLSEAEGAGAFLRGKLVPVKPVTEERLKKLIGDLESETFAVRESATKALAELGEIAVPAMRKALANKPPLETRKRLEGLIQRIETKTLTTEELRIWRASDVLERLGTTEARALLKALAAGAPGARATTAARDALKRLER